MISAEQHAVQRRAVPRRHDSAPAASQSVSLPAATSSGVPTGTRSSARSSARSSTTVAAVAPPIHQAREALTEARRLRAEYLVALASGLVTAHDVVQAALTDEGKPLRRISLRQLHLSQQGWGERRTNRLLSVLAERLGANDAVQDMTISWLIDPRSGGRRYLTWLDAQQGKTRAPWTGFPFTAPEGDR